MSYVKRFYLRIATTAFASLMTIAVQGEVVRFEILEIESPTFEGLEFAAVGPYEKIIGRAYMEVDPHDPHNSGIVDLALAERNAAGHVEFSTEVVILKPVDLNKGNKRIFYDVLNRGRKVGLSLMNDAPSTKDLTRAANAGNGYLMRMGYTIVWSGWQADVPPGEERMWLEVPTIKDVTDTNRDEFIFDNDYDPAVAHLSYPAANLDVTKATLTVRQNENDVRLSPEDLSFEYLYVDRGGVRAHSASEILIHRPEGFDAGAIYEFTYTATDPIIMGLAFASTRDVVSFLRRESNGNPLASDEVPAIEYAYALGISQSGRFLRDSLYQGFNEDERGRIVFDGIIPHVAGSRKMFTNFRWAQPGRYSRQHESHLTPGDQFPFTYGVMTDSLTGQRDGILARCLESGNCPKIMHTDTGTEFWQARSSLIVTDTSGTDIELPPNVRVYFIASTPHGVAIDANPSETPTCQQLSNPLHCGGPMRALLHALDRWVSDGIEPPASQFPSRADGTLIDLETSIAKFPDVPGVNYKGTVNGLRVTHYDQSVPEQGATYPVFVPRVDLDGNDVAGIRLPRIQVPVGTYLGWNLRRQGFAEGELCGLTGSFIPFPQTRADRLKSGDPRLSLEERYPNHKAYVRGVEQAVRDLMEHRFLLEEDAQRVLDAAKASTIPKPTSQPPPCN